MSTSLLVDASPLLAKFSLSSKEHVAYRNPDVQYVLDLVGLDSFLDICMCGDVDVMEENLIDLLTMDESHGATLPSHPGYLAELQALSVDVNQFVTRLIKERLMHYPALQDKGFAVDGFFTPTVLLVVLL